MPTRRSDDLSFAEYLLFVARPAENARGDFVRDARAEIEAGRFPAARCWSRLQQHLAARGACPEAVAVARLEWSRYARRGWWSAEQRRRAAEWRQRCRSARRCRSLEATHHA